ncbi:MAG: hypothetical protein AAGD25_20495 [Cyanobacteria bacterium P01_F01_bin.150]
MSSSHVSESQSNRRTRRSLRSPILNWQTTVLLGLSIWMGCSVVLDLVIMPTLYGAGMMKQSAFASAGYSLFWVFNRIELVFAALVLTGVLALYSMLRPTGQMGKWAITLAVFLLAIPLIYTYALTPSMSALGLEFVPFDLSELRQAIPVTMDQLHRDYFGLEALKFGLAGGLLVLSYRLLPAEQY